MISKAQLDQLYRKYNRKKYVHPDPLQFLYQYPEVRDCEIVALIASALAYGRVAQILKSVETVLARMGQSPYAFLRETDVNSLNRIFSGFRHRFATDADLVSLMTGIRKVTSDHGSLNACFLVGMHRTDETILPALQQFATKLGDTGAAPSIDGIKPGYGARRSPGRGRASVRAGGQAGYAAVHGRNHLVPSPEKGSACKRLNLFLRWMVRKHAVDPGGWKGIPRSKLIVPLDTHMAKIGRVLGMTQRKSADMNMALEITESFRKLCPKDPVKYDFALTRFGIRSDLDLKLLYGLAPPPR